MLHHAPFALLGAALATPAITPAAAEWPSNRAPLLHAEPLLRGRVGRFVAYTPYVGDPDGDPVTIHVLEGPSWLEYDQRSGAIWGVPAAAGRAHVRLRASDGRVAVERTIEIDVDVDLEMATLERSATVSWTPPTERVDGTPLDALSGYAIYWGREPAHLDRRLVVEDPGATAMRVDGLETGTWHFAVASIDGTGLESEPSATVEFAVVLD